MKEELEAAFRAAFATPKDRPGDVAAARLAFLHEAALAIDSDLPFPLDRVGYADHLAFHGPHWERLEVQLIEVKAQVHGNTGIVSAYFNLRGKPRDAGFRQRPGYVTAVCTRDGTTGGGSWRALGLHMSPMMAQILQASPG
jgi:ketosteroid isomerase-like protein